MTLRRLLVLWLGAPILIGAVGLLLGQDANWDFRNYHYYNGYAFLNGRLGFDLLPANHPTYYNPLLDAAVYWAMQVMPAWQVAFLLGSLQGLMAPLLYNIALLVTPAVPRQKLVAAIVAAAGCTGAMTVSEIGATFHDNTLAVPVLAGLWLLLLALSGRVTGNRFWAAIATSAFLIGLACGFKLTMSLYALGLIAALTVALPWRQLLIGAPLAGAAGLVGFLTTGGYWSWFLWTHFHNPLFPHFNNIFHSHFAGDTAFRDLKFIEKLSLIERLFLPLFSTFNSWLVAEADFLDARLLAAFVLCLPALFFLRSAPGTLRGVIVFSVAAYVGWVWLYCIYRYVLPLEMLAPILCLAALLTFGLEPVRALTVAAAIAVILTLTTGYPVALEPVRRTFGTHFVVVTGLPTIGDDTMLVMAGDHPAAFILPSLPPAVRVIRINDWPFLDQSGQDGFEPLIRRTIANHSGPMLMLTHPEDRDRARNIAMLFGLRLLDDCSAVSTNLIDDKFLICKLQRWRAQ
jgi:hypothetical protein